MRERHTLVCAFVVVSLLFAHQALAPDKPRLIAWLGVANPVAAKAYVDAFHDELARLGWTNERDVVFKYFFANGDTTRMDRLAAEAVALKPDAIYVTSNKGALALRRLTHSIPVVFVTYNDPVASGLVKSLRYPGENMTGVAAVPGPELWGKDIQLLKEWFPQLTRLAVLVDPDDPSFTERFLDLAKFAEQQDIRVVKLPVRNAADIDAAFARLARDRADALYVFSSVPTYTYRQMIAAHALANRIPSMARNTQFADAGVLLAYGMHNEGMARLGARYVNRILRGAKPAEMPVEQPTEFELVINMKTAKAIGVDVPAAIRLQATRFIE